MEYLADEIEGLVGADGLRVLEATALCGRVTERMAETAVGSATGGGVLGTLAEASVLVVPLEDPGGWYRYHALLGEFLRARADALGPEERRGLHLRTAEALVAEGEVREAVPHLLEAEAFARAADLIVPIADELAGREPAVLQDWLDALPGGMVDERPALIAASAILLFGARRYEEAFDRMYLAMSRFAARGEAEPAATTLFRLLELLEVACEFGRAVEVCESVLPTLDAGNGLAAAAVRLRLASSLGNLGRIDEAEAIVREIEGSAVAEGAPVLHTYAQFVRAWAVEHPRGRSRDAIATMTRVADTLEADPAGDFLRLLPWVYALRSIVCHALEETGAMKADGDRFAELAFRYEIDIAARDIVTRIALFQALVDGRLDEMDELVARWDAHYVAWRDINWNCLYFPLVTVLHLQRGRIAQALSALTYFRDTLITRGPVIAQARMMPDGALLALQAGDIELARQMSRHGLAAAERAGAPWALVHANAVGSLCWQETPEGAAMLTRALEASNGHGAVDAWTRIDRLIAPQLLSAAMAHGLGPRETVIAMTAACGGEVVAAMAEILTDAPASARVMLAEAVAEATVDAEVVDRLLRDREPAVREAARAAWTRRRQGARARIHIVSFGRLMILRDGRPLDVAAFARQKSRGLLAALVATGGAVDRDRLSEWLWPDLDPERASGALRTTLHDLRRGIEPEVEAGSGQALIRSEGDRVELVLGEQDDWDLVDFREHHARARAAQDPADRIAPLLSAERLSAAPFLGDWASEDWTREVRTEVDRQALEVRAQLADAFMAIGRPEEAISRLRRLCEAEPEREHWHRSLMRAYSAAGDRALALRQFHLLRGQLRREQGIEPSEATRQLYRDLLADPGAAANL